MASAFSRFARRAGLVTFRQIFVRLGHVRKLPLLPQGSKAMMKWKEQLNGDCPKARCTQPARALRLDMSGFAESVIEA
jgi:hypothetical protein